MNDIKVNLKPLLQWGSLVNTYIVGEDDKYFFLKSFGKFIIKTPKETFFKEIRVIGFRLTDTERTLGLCVCISIG